MKVYVFNKVCSDGWDNGNEAIPEVYMTLEKAVDEGYERYLKVWNQCMEEDDLDSWEKETGPISKQEFFDIADCGNGYIVIQCCNYHYQYEFYVAEVKA